MQKSMKCLVSSILLCVLLAGCSAGESGSSDKQQEGIAVEHTAGSVESAPTVEELEESKIETAYGTLYYPKQWEEYVTTEQQENGDTIVVSFIATLHNTSYRLFEVTIGGTEGAAAGELTDNGGTKRTVYMQVYELEGDSELTATEQNRLYAMQEDLNYLIDHLE
ncbi:hypothetical protein [Fusibacillus kribbianus]|uniref:Lipoprotein n=1 Tax=Fusibacillus kribbianus TaxID=3044208 RepID=A0AAP4BBA7_9FIRM|nr:hypothetical protein [Ruminococcus sp. YH-rum2234]MDI9242490.1 hypothetical protein [Ruminococcus sp. YH-rum2234]